MKQMKLIPTMLTATIAGLTMFQSCTKIANQLQYNLDMHSGSVTVMIPPVSNTSSEATIGSGINNINVDSFVKAHTAGLLGAANIMSVKLTSCTMTLENANAANNFADFQTAHAQFSSNSEVSPYQLSIPSNPDVYSSTLALPVDTTTELKNYMLGSQYNYAVGGKLRRPTTDSLKCTIKFQFRLRVQG